MKQHHYQRYQSEMSELVMSLRKLEDSISGDDKLFQVDGNRESLEENKGLLIKKNIENQSFILKLEDLGKRIEKSLGKEKNLHLKKKLEEVSHLFQDLDQVYSRRLDAQGELLRAMIAFYELCFQKARGSSSREIQDELEMAQADIIKKAKELGRLYH